MDEKKVFKDRLATDDILREAASLAKEDIMVRQQQYEDRAKSIDQVFTVEPDAAFLQFARTYNQQHSEEQVKRKTTYVTKRFVRFAAIFLACFVTLGSMAIGTSEALREQIFSFFFNEETGSVTLRNETEEDMIGSWNEYWYPTWLPDGFYLLGVAREDCVFMLFASENDTCRIRIREYELHTTSISMDTDDAAVEKIKVGSKNVVLSVDEENGIMTAVWMTDTKILKIDMNECSDREMLIKIIENMQYVK